jgi:hypothetical protein
MEGCTWRATQFIAQGTHQASIGGDWDVSAPHAKLFGQPNPEKRKTVLHYYVDGLWEL